jgi:hypothetical protein
MAWVHRPFTPAAAAAFSAAFGTGQLAPKPMCDVVILELIASPKFGALMTDPFGNYVIQKAMAVAQDDTLASLMAAIRPLVDKLRTAQYGRRIYNRFYKHERIRTEEPAI